MPACEVAPGPINKYYHQIVPAYQRPTIERWAAAIAKLNKTDSVRVRVRARVRVKVKVRS